ncbi:SGNH/GDSL hydrolase family protein [Gordonia sp. NPDC003950]
MPRIVTLATAARWRTPTALWQGLRAQRIVLRLPQADGDDGVITGDTGDGTTRLLVIGDSLAGGVGVAHHHHTLAGGVAGRLAERLGGEVHWHVRARTGYTAGEVITLIDPDLLANADVVIVSVGANDTKNMHTPRRWRTELTALLAEITSGAAQSARIVLLPVPMLQMCPALPRTLATVLGARAAHFDDIASQVSAGFPGIGRFARFVPPGGADLFAADGFHPSESFHAIYAEQIDAVLRADSVSGESAQGSGCGDPTMTELDHF